MEKLIDAIRNAKSVAAMTGAGVSTLCGIPDFRGPQGLYKNPDAERIFDIDWFDRDPSVYYRGCRELVYGLGSFTPGPVHRALKTLEDAGRLLADTAEVIYARCVGEGACFAQDWSREPKDFTTNFMRCANTLAMVSGIIRPTPHPSSACAPIRDHMESV